MTDSQKRFSLIGMININNISSTNLDRFCSCSTSDSPFSERKDFQNRCRISRVMSLTEETAFLVIIPEPLPVPSPQFFNYLLGKKAF